MSDQLFHSDREVRAFMPTLHGHSGPSSPKVQGCRHGLAHAAGRGHSVGASTSTRAFSLFRPGGRSTDEFGSSLCTLFRLVPSFSARPTERSETRCLIHQQDRRTSADPSHLFCRVSSTVALFSPVPPTVVSCRLSRPTAAGNSSTRH